MRKISPRERPTPAEMSAMLSGLCAVASSSMMSSPLSRAGARYLAGALGMGVAVGEVGWKRTGSRQCTQVPARHAAYAALQLVMPMNYAFIFVQDGRRHRRPPPGPTLDNGMPQTTTTEVMDLPAGRTGNGNRLALVLVISLFFLWGVANNLNDVLVAQFKKAFTLSDLQAGLVQAAFYLGYFLVAAPAGLFMRRFGYK